jgi:hypothetical protein
VSACRRGTRLTSLLMDRDWGPAHCEIAVVMKAVSRSRQGKHRFLTSTRRGRTVWGAHSQARLEKLKIECFRIIQLTLRITVRTASDKSSVASASLAAQDGRVWHFETKLQTDRSMPQAAHKQWLKMELQSWVGLGYRVSSKSCCSAVATQRRRPTPIQHRHGTQWPLIIVTSNLPHEALR